MSKFKLHVSQYIFVFWFIVSTATLIFMLFGCGARQRPCLADNSATWQLVFYFEGGDCGVSGSFPYWVTAYDNEEKDILVDAMGSDVCFGSARNDRYLDATCSGTFPNGANYVFTYRIEQKNTVAFGQGEVTIVAGDFSCKQTFVIGGTYEP